MGFVSQYLSARQIQGLTKVGDVYAPGDDELPSFSACGCVEHVDDVLAYLPPDDREGLKLLLGLLSLVPQSMLARGAALLERAPAMQGALGGPLRFLRMGLKGLVYTLYYSGRTGREFAGPSSHQVLGYQVGVYTGDLPQGANSPH